MATIKLGFQLFIVCLMFLMSCGTHGKNKKKSKEPFRYPTRAEMDARNYTYECEFSDRVALSDVPEGYTNEFCPVNGVLLTVGGDAGYLSNCSHVRFICDYDEVYQVVGLRHNLVECITPPSTRICHYKGWMLKHCFKFFDDIGRKCDCEHGEVTCENQNQ